MLAGWLGDMEAVVLAACSARRRRRRSAARILGRRWRGFWDGDWGFGSSMGGERWGMGNGRENLSEPQRADGRPDGIKMARSHGACIRWYCYPVAKASCPVVHR